MTTGRRRSPLWGWVEEPLLSTRTRGASHEQYLRRVDDEDDDHKGVRWFVRETIFAVIIVALLAAFGFWKFVLILVGLGLLLGIAKFLWHRTGNAAHRRRAP